MKKFFSKTIYKKYLLSFSISLILPLFIFGIIMYNSFTHILKQEIDRYSLDMLSAIQKNIDLRIEELNNITFQASQEPRLRNIRHTDDYLTVIEAVKTLRNFLSTNKFSSEMILYYKSHNLIYSSSGTYKADQFSDYIYKYENWNSEQFFDELDSISKVIVRPAEKVRIPSMLNVDEKFITYITPFPSNSPNPDGALFYLINESSFNKMFSEILKTNNGSVVIFDADQKLLTGYGKNMEECINLVSLSGFRANEFSKRTSINGIEYSLSSIKSYTTGWTYVILVPLNTIYQKMTPLVSMALTGLVIAAFLGCFAVYFLTTFNYKPIKDLKGFVLKSIGEDTPSKDELETVKIAVSRMSNTISTLKKKVDVSIPGIRATVLAKLIKGDYYSIPDFNAFSSDTGIVLREGLYAVIVLLFNSGNKIDSAAIIKSVENLSVEDATYYGLDNLDESKIVFILSTESISENTLSLCVSGINTILLENFALEVTVGVSNWISDIGDMGIAFMQALSALDYRFIKGKNTVIYYSELKGLVNQTEYYPKEKLDMLEIYILQGDEEKVLNILHEIFKEIKNNDLPLFIARSLCYHITNSIYNTIYRLKSGLNLKEYKYSDVAALIKSETIEDLSDEIVKFCMHICSVIHQYKSDHEKNKLEKMIEYIHNNFSDPDFSIQNMACHFNIPISSISIYFKNQTGENISDYVNQLRIESAKKLLTGTEWSIHEIVNRVGYINMSSFTRRFKECTGTTPRDYRQLMKRDNSNREITN